MEEELAYEIEWRIKEISILKTLPFNRRFTDVQKATYLRHSFPALYSLWEGFVCTAFEIYIRKINDELVYYKDLSINLKTHFIDSALQLHNARVNFEKKKKFVGDIDQIMLKVVKIKSDIPTESNINYKVINNILLRFNLNLLPETPYKKDLDKLLLIRNKIAHGEFSIPVDTNLLCELSQVVIDLMIEVYQIIIDGYNSKTFLVS